MGNHQPEQSGGDDEFEKFDEKYGEEDEGMKKLREQSIEEFKKRHKPKKKRIFRFSAAETLKTNVKDFYLIDDDDDIETENNDDFRENELVLGDIEANKSYLEAEKVLEIGALLPHTPSWKSPQDGIRFVMMKPMGFSVEKTMDAEDGEVKMVLYFPKHKKMLSLSKSLIVWSTGAFGRQTHQIHVKDKHIMHMIKWDENEVLYGGKDATVKCISVAKNFKIVAFFRASESAIIRLLRLDDHHFAAMNEKGFILIFSYLLKSFIRRLVKTFEGNYRKSPLMIRSKVYPNCLYYNTVDSRNNCHKVKLVDYVKDECLLEFTNHNEIHTIETILTKAGKEVLLVGTHKHWITMINTETGITNILKPSKKSIGYPTTMFCYYNRYILIGTNRGHLNLLDVKKNYIDLKVHGSTFRNHHHSKINDVKFYYYYQNVSHSRFSVLRDDDSLRLFTCSNDGKIKAVQLKLVNSKDEEDGEGENRGEEEQSLLGKNTI